MKNYNLIFWLLLAIAIGFGFGFFVSKKSNDGANIEEEHQHEAMASNSVEDATIWTCSMHPQIRQDEPGNCPICGMDLIPLVNSGNSDDPLVLEMTDAAVKLANIQTTVVGQTGKAEKTILLNGKIQADERLSASQVAHIPGRIEQLYVTFTGEWVKKGQKLVTIYSPELVTAQQELFEAIKFQDVNPNLVEAARNKLRYWKIPEKSIQKIEKNGKIQETFTIYADAGGVVTHRRVSVGNYVKLGQVLFDIIDLNKLWVLFDAYEEDLAHIRMGAKVEFTTPAQPNKTFKTRITFIDPVINPATRTASLRAEISNLGGLLKPEMFVRGEVKSRIARNEKLLVPKSAVLWTGKRSVVYVKLQDTAIPSFKYREILLGDTVGDSYLIEEGLEAGEEIVTYGNFAIDAAAQLNNQQSMMNQVIKVKGTQASLVPDYTATTPDAFKNQLKELAGQYLLLKEAFVATDAKAAANAAAKFLKNLKKVDMRLLKGEAHLFWMDQIKGMQGHAAQINKLEEVEEQRRQFGYLSELLIDAIQSFGNEGNELFVIHCPMAFDHEGADWISAEKEIRNPYFGDKMLTCGTVIDSFPASKESPFPDVKQLKSNHNH